MQMTHPFVYITMANQAVIQLELYPEKAPASVRGFVDMILQHAYDGMAIQRIVPDFVIQPWYDEMKMPDIFQAVISGEFAENGFLENDLPFTQYAVGLAGDGEHTSSPSCFFITIGTESFQRLQGKFACIGYVKEGFEELTRLASLPLQNIPSGVEGVEIYCPIHPQCIQSIRVDLRGYPKTI